MFAVSKVVRGFGGSTKFTQLERSFPARFFWVRVSKSRLDNEQQVRVHHKLGPRHMLHAYQVVCWQESAQQRQRYAEKVLVPECGKNSLLKGQEKSQITSSQSVCRYHLTGSFPTYSALEFSSWKATSSTSLNSTLQCADEPHQMANSCWMQLSNKVRCFICWLWGWIGKSRKRNEDLECSSRGLAATCCRHRQSLCMCWLTTNAESLF